MFIYSMLIAFKAESFRSNHINNVNNLVIIPAAVVLTGLEIKSQVFLSCVYTTRFKARFSLADSFLKIDKHKISAH